MTEHINHICGGKQQHSWFKSITVQVVMYSIIVDNKKDYVTALCNHHAILCIILVFIHLYNKAYYKTICPVSPPAACYNPCLLSMASRGDIQ